MSPELRDDLRAARSYLSSRGWCAGSFGDGPACGIAAALLIVMGLEWVPSRKDRLKEALDALSLGLGFEEIGEWERVPGRTQSDILALFDQVTSTYS